MPYEPPVAPRWHLTGVAGTALGLSTGRHVHKHRKKQLAVIGTVISAVTLAGVLLVVARD